MAPDEIAMGAQGAKQAQSQASARQGRREPWVEALHRACDPRPESIANFMHNSLPFATGVEFTDWRGIARIFSLGRTRLYELAAEGRIKSVLLRRPGNLSGRRLIHVESVRRYLMEEMRKQVQFSPAVCNAHAHAKKGEKRGDGRNGRAAASSAQDGKTGEVS